MAMQGHKRITELGRGTAFSSGLHRQRVDEFTKLADRTSPVVGWLRALAASAHRECGGPGVGVVGMCFTGGFALATALEPSVVASVMSQPAMPAPIGERGRAALGLDAEDLAAITARANDDLRVLGLRFTNDRGCPAERFETLRATLGASFEGIEIDSSLGNPAGYAGQSAVRCGLSCRRTLIGPARAAVRSFGRCPPGIRCSPGWTSGTRSPQPGWESPEPDAHGPLGHRR